VADDIETAVRKRLRETIITSGTVTAHLADRFAVSLFGSAGGRERPQPTIERVLSGRDACHLSGVRVLPLPRLSELTVITGRDS